MIRYAKKLEVAEGGIELEVYEVTPHLLELQASTWPIGLGDTVELNVAQVDQLIDALKRAKDNMENVG